VSSPRSIKRRTVRVEHPKISAICRTVKNLISCGGDPPHEFRSRFLPSDTRAFSESLAAGGRRRLFPDAAWPSQQNLLLLSSVIIVETLPFMSPGRSAGQARLDPVLIASGSTCGSDCK
jgi:hypothetical protein